MLRSTRAAKDGWKFSDEPTQEGRAAGAERGGTSGSGPAQPLRRGVGSGGGGRHGRAGGGHWGDLYSGSARGRAELATDQELARDAELAPDRRGGAAAQGRAGAQ